MIVKSRSRQRRVTAQKAPGAALAETIVKVDHILERPVAAPETGLVVGYVKSRNWSSKLIEWWGAGGWCHATTLVAPGWVIDARYQGGVARRPVSYLTGSEVEWLRVPCSQAAVNATIAALESQIGKPYDWAAIAAFASQRLAALVNRDWRSNKSWFCSEVQGWAGEQGGAWPTLRTPRVSLTPGDMRLVASARGAVKLPGPIFG
jgi:hypothetical protein